MSELYLTLTNLRPFQVRSVSVSLIETFLNLLKFHIFPEPSPAKRRRLSVDSLESLGSVLPVTPSSSVGDVGFLDDSAYGGAYAPNYSDHTEAAAQDTDQSGYETGNEIGSYADYVRNPDLYTFSPLVPSPLDVKEEEHESDSDVIYVETVTARRTSGPLIDLN